MSTMHQPNPAGEWTVAPGTATRLAASPLPRWLAVSAGRAWLTRTGAGPEGDDVWLSDGQRHALPAGSEWVLEASPQARLMLLQAPQAPAQARFRLGAWLHAA
jgi:Protein of unknown function (DUF2917)